MLVLLLVDEYVADVQISFVYEVVLRVLYIARKLRRYIEMFDLSPLAIIFYTRAIYFINKRIYDYP